MKTLNLSAMLLAISLLVGTASCSESELPEPSNDGQVTFNLQLQPKTTRGGSATFGLGMYATSLKCLVFDNENKFLTETSTILSHGQGSVNLNLVTGVNYKLLFWADSGSDFSPYTLSNSGEVSVNLDKVQANSEYNDAFYAVKEYKGGTSASENITLTRPFAQVNFGTDDADKTLVKEGYPDGVYTTVTTNLYTKMNLLNGEVLNKQEYTTKLATTASMSAESFPAVHKQEGKKYDYVNMLYAMVPKEGFTSDITLKAYNGSTESAKPIETINVPSAPMKQNWRTNIFGSLYTSDTNFNVIIDNHFIDQTNLDLNNEINVNTFSELQAAVKKANTTPNTTILVNSDITIPEDSTLYFKGTNTTFDIAKGKTLTLTSTPGALYSYFPLKITKEATVTFCGQGKITGDVHMLENYGNLTINSGHYVITGSTIIDHEGKLTINGGYFEGSAVLFKWGYVKDSYAIINGGEFHATRECFDYIGSSGDKNFTIKNGLFISNNRIAYLPSINVSGGTFISNSSDPKLPLFDIYDYYATISGGDFYVSKNTQMETFEFGNKVEVQITGGRYSSIEGFSPSSGFEWKQINEPALPDTRPLLYQIVPSAK